MKMTLFLSGIDTDAGKSWAAGWLAKRFMNQGLKVITQKFIQTGCEETSEDIDVHRRIMGIPYQPVDVQRLTAPIIFKYPASAQLAASLENKVIDLKVIDKARQQLEAIYDVVIIEGAGGLKVPVTDDFMAIDYAASRSLPIALVTNARLGSINHTVLSLEAIKHAELSLPYLLFNHHFDTDAVISADTRAWIERYVKRNFPETQILDIPSIVCK